MKNVAYKTTSDMYGVLYYRLLKPTGRWKLINNPNYINLLLIEHQGILFKSWISEYNIVFKPETTEKIFECNR